MKRRSRALVALMLIITPTLANCGDVGNPVAPDQPQVTAPNELLGLVGGLLGVVTGVVGGVVGGLVGVLDGLLTGPDAVGEHAAKWIGPEGGSLSTAAYTLIVPRNAVSQKSLFEMQPALDGGYSIELTARRVVSGRWVDVGGKGFNVPVRLRISYARANGVTDPTKLIVVYVNEQIIAEPQPTVVDRTNRTASGSLSHFSRYALVQD